MPFSQLTAISVERACRTRQRFLLNDGQGLYLRKQASSGASWTLRYRFLESARWMTLGNYPDMSLAAARVEARAKRLLDLAARFEWDTALIVEDIRQFR